MVYGGISVEDGGEARLVMGLGLLGEPLAHV